jgi:TetR/AcrR family transcriptional regulator, tetracycline repressor protein
MNVAKGEPGEPLAHERRQQMREQMRQMQQQAREQRQQMQEQQRQLIREHHEQMWELHRGGRGRGRGAHEQQRPRLSREEVARVALAIVDREGLDGLSMRKLGAALHVDPMAAYHYFPNKAALLDGIVDAVYAEIPPAPEPDAPWDEQLRQLLRAYRRVLKAHPHALPALATHPTFTEASFRQLEAAGAILYRAGLSPPDAMRVIGQLSGLLIGLTLAEVGLQPGGIADPTEDEVLARVAELPPEDYPVVTAAARSREIFDHDRDFESGIDTFIAGLMVQHPNIARAMAAPTARQARARVRAPARSHGRARRG